MKGSEVMKKIVWGTLFVLGIASLAIGVMRFDTSAQEAELFVDVLLDIDDQDYELDYGERKYGGYRQPLAFISLGQAVKEDVLEKAELYGIEPAHYVLAITVSTYDESYDLMTVIETIQQADEDALILYLDELKAALEANAEAIKASLDGIKETYQLELQAIKESYVDEVKELIEVIKSTTDENELSRLHSELEALKEQIQAEVGVIRDAFVQSLEEEGIAIEGLYGMFMRQMEDRFEQRMIHFEKRFPRLYQRIKNHFTKD